MKRRKVNPILYIRQSVKCPHCGHTQMLYKDKRICTYCGHWVYRNKKIEFKEKLISLMKKI